MAQKFETILIRFIISALFIAVLATVWDVWWHAFVGRDTLFEPPPVSCLQPKSGFLV